MSLKPACSGVAKTEDDHVDDGSMRMRASVQVGNGTSHELGAARLSSRADTHWRLPISPTRALSKLLSFGRRWRMR